MLEWVIGVLINITGSLLVNLGTLLIKSGHQLENKGKEKVDDGGNEDLNKFNFPTSNASSSTTSSSSLSSSLSSSSSLSTSAFTLSSSISISSSSASSIPMSSSPSMPSSSSVISNLSSSANLLPSMSTSPSSSLLTSNSVHPEIASETSMITAAAGTPRAWKLGVTLFVLGSITNFISFAFAAQSLLAALGSVQFVSNVFFARCILNEKPTNLTYISTGIILIGVVTVVCFANHNTLSYTSDQLIRLYDRTYLSFLFVLSILLILAEGIYILYTHREQQKQPLPFTFLVRPISYSFVSATIGTQSILQSKCLAELVKGAIIANSQGASNHENNNSNSNGDGDGNASSLYYEFHIYAVFLAFLVGISFWLYRLNNALKHFPGLVIIPLLQVFWTTTAIVQGGMFFDDFEGFTLTQGLGFVSGLCIVFFGVFLLTTTTQDNKTRSSSGNTDSISPNYKEMERLEAYDDEDDEFDFEVELKPLSPTSLSTSTTLTSSTVMTTTT